jgi:hypothetical protein
MRKPAFLSAMFIVLMTVAMAPTWAAPPPATIQNAYFLYNQWGGTWHDANKTAANTEDDLMCWAAAASNVLAWGDWGTPAYNTTDKIFKHVQDHWTDNTGYPRWAWRWWFDGTPAPNKAASYVDVPGGGAFYPTLNFYDYYLSFYDNISLMANIDQLLQWGYGVTLTIRPPSQNYHAITLWGFGYDMVNGNKVYKSIYVTDSDDGFYGLKNYNINQVNGGWYMTSGYNGWELYTVQALKLNFLDAPGAAPLHTPVPPSAMLVLSGLLALFLTPRPIKRGAIRRSPL